MQGDLLVFPCSAAAVRATARERTRLAAVGGRQGVELTSSFGSVREEHDSKERDGRQSERHSLEREETGAGSHDEREGQLLPLFSDSVCSTVRPLSCAVGPAPAKALLHPKKIAPRPTSTTDCAARRQRTPPVGHAQKFESPSQGRRVVLLAAQQQIAAHPPPMNNGVPLGSDFQLAEDASTEGNSLEGRSRQGAKQPVTPAAGPRLSPEVEEHLHNMKLERDAAFALVDAKKAELQKKLADMSSDYSAQFDRRVDATPPARKRLS